MWDWIKSSAGAAFQRGAEYFQHVSAIQRIIQGSSYEAALVTLRAYLDTLRDQAAFDSFMQVVGQAVNQAQLELQQARSSPSGPAWGNSFEDRMAQGMAEIRAGVTAGNSAHVGAAEKKLHDLTLLASYAQQMWQERQARQGAGQSQPWTSAATSDAGQPAGTPLEVFQKYLTGLTQTPAAAASSPGPADRLAAFQRHMRSIAAMGSGGGQMPDRPAAQEPVSEMDALKRMLEADRRLMAGMMACMPGTASAAVVADLEQLHDEYQAILRDAPANGTLVTTAGLRRKMAECMEMAGRASESLRDDPKAIDFFRKAASMFSAAGDGAAATRVEAKVQHLGGVLRGDDDAEITALQEKLGTLPLDSLGAARTLVSLGAACGRAGDTYAAREHLHRAEALLERLGHAPPNAGSLAQDLFGSLGAISEGRQQSGPTAIEQSMMLRGLYKELFQALAQAYGDVDPAAPDAADQLERASAYIRKLEEMDSEGESQAFGDAAMKLLDGPFAKLLKK